jgi:hypothetical protein
VSNSIFDIFCTVPFCVAYSSGVNTLLILWWDYGAADISVRHNATQAAYNLDPVVVQIV